APVNCIDVIKRSPHGNNRQDMKKTENYRSFGFPPLDVIAFSIAPINESFSNSPVERAMRRPWSITT
ncbi:MAG: hypothetical protein ACYC5X_01170, partial [Syntrophales bacterium]